MTDETPAKAPAKGAADVTLSVVAPFYFDSFELPGVAVVRKGGTVVKAGDVDRIIAAAAEAGITIAKSGE